MLKTPFLAIAFHFCAPLLYAQSPVKWSFAAKKMAGRANDLILIADVNTPWHIYSQTTPDGGPVATTIRFNKNALVVLQGTAKEKGKLLQKHEEVFGVDVKYFEGTVNFVQTVQVKANVKTNISGNVRFMVCNDQQCLASTEVPFNISLN